MSLSFDAADLLPRAPVARGRLSATSLAELLFLALERRSTGSFVFETPANDKSALVVAGGRVTKVRTAEPVAPLGQLLIDGGVIDSSTLEQALRLARERSDRLGQALLQLSALERRVLERSLREQLGRRLGWLGQQLPEQSAYAFYAGVDFLNDRPACEVDPLELIWRYVRDGQGAHPRQEAALSGLGARPLRLTARAVLERFELTPSERACFERLRTEPLALEALVERTGLEAALARRSIYALLLTRQLEPLALASTPPTGRSSRAPADAPGPRADASWRPSAPASPAPAAAPATGFSSLPPATTILPPAGASRSERPVRSSSVPPPPDHIENALARASRLVRERTRAEGAARAARAVAAARESIARKHYAEAEAHLREACRVDPGNPEHLALHAWVRAQNGELATPAFAAQIVAALDRAAMKAPESVTVRFQRAQVLKRLGRDDDAYKDFRFVARRDPSNIDALREVRLYVMRNRNKERQSGIFSKLFSR